MTRKTEEYKQELLNIIQENNIAFFDHCFAFTTFSRATAYNHELDKVDELKDSIYKNRVKCKNYLLNKWIESDNTTLQISAYRLLSVPQEHKLLNQSYVDHTTDGEKVGEVDMTKLSDKTLEELKKAKDENNS